MSKFCKHLWHTFDERLWMVSSMVVPSEPSSASARQGFMIQTGDPQGDGTGGESIWGGEFEAPNGNS